MEECDHTSDPHAQISDKDVAGILDAVGVSPKNHPGPETVDSASGIGGYYLERVLLRFVFEQEGRPLSEARSSLEVLDSTVQWLDGKTHFITKSRHHTLTEHC